jgi:hypothetical protein
LPAQLIVPAQSPIERAFIENWASAFSRLADPLLAEQPENIVLEHLRALRADIGDMKGEMRTLKAEMATKSDLQALKSDLRSLRAEVASDLAAMQKETREQIVGLRRAVIEYHSAAGPCRPRTVSGHAPCLGNSHARAR